MVRFETSQALFEAFPEAQKSITVEPTEEHSLTVLRGLAAKGKLEDAVAFCAYVLPRREAVWWACRTVRAFLNETANKHFDVRPVEVAEAWVGQPEEQRRLAAEAARARGDPDSPTTWVAAAAAWAGGAYAAGNSTPVAMPQQLTAHAAIVAIQLCSRRVGMPRSGTRLRTCIEEGIKLAETGL
jgi:hypothetical protein